MMGDVDQGLRGLLADTQNLIAAGGRGWALWF
jgi:hypothetical protein